MIRLLILLIVLSFSGNAFATVTVSVIPDVGSCLPGSVRTVYSNVQGDANTAVTWTTSGGSLDTSNTGYAIWTAPGSVGTYTVTATSVADGTQTATSTFTVVQPNVRLSIIPAQITLYKNQPAVLQAILYGSTNTAVTWTKSGGSLTGTGREVVFTASAAGTYTVTATSVADPAKTYTSTIVVTSNSFPAARTNRTEPVDCTAVGSGTTYDVTNSATFDAVPWATLAAGDTVRIHNNGTPYYRQILLKTSGTASQPIRVCGVPDSNGNLPEINGANATAYTGANFGTPPYSIQLYGGIVIYNASAPYYGPTDPHDIIIEGLKVTGFKRSNSYTDSADGVVKLYDYAAAAVRVHRGANITLRGNEIADNGNGLFAATNNGTLAHATVNLLVQGNYLHDNNNVNRSTEHQSYLQALGLVVQGNYYGTIRTGAYGAQLKTRAVQQFLRYNYLERGSRVFDLVEVQDSPALVFPWVGLSPGELAYTSENDVVANYEAYQNQYVYGNIVYNTGTGAALWVLHGAADTLTPDYNPGGILHFYHNTVYTDVGWGAGIVDFGPYSLPATPKTSWPTANLQNNAILINNIMPPTYANPYFYWNRYKSDRVRLGKNWANSNWGTGNSSGGALTGISNTSVNSANVYQSGMLSTQVQGTANLLTGTSSPVYAATYDSPPGGALINASATLTGLASSFPPLMQYSPVTFLMSARSDVKDIGAREGVLPPAPPPAESAFSLSGLLSGSLH